jgi:HK97 family phage prohead protease
MEKKTFDFNIQKAEKNTFEGYASTFGNVDRDGDIVEKGAFQSSLKNHVLVLYQHQEPIGKAIEMKEDDHGLYVKAKISDTERGKEVMTLIKDGVISRLSIGFDIKDFEYTPEGRILKDVDLLEFSAVAFPANPLAAITNAKGGFQAKEYKISGEKLNDFLSFFDEFFEQNPIEKGAAVIETVTCKEMDDFYQDMKAMFDLTIEEVS